MKETIQETPSPEPITLNPRSEEPILNQALNIALDDEFHAYEAYMTVIEAFGAQPPFASIVEAEKRHQHAILELLARHEIAPIPNRWEGVLKAPESLHEAYKMGAEAEIANIVMYDTLLAYTQHYPDVQEVFYRLQAASYNNHLPAFQRHLEHKDAAKNDTVSAPSEAALAMDSMTQQINEWSTIASKIANGEMNQEEIFKVMSNTNMSFIAGALLGALGVGVVGAMANKHEDKNEKE